jgi:iron complex transport system permease protein
MLAASIATGAAVATAGAIGFVGLVVPHALRLAGVRAAPWLLPASALGGGAFVVVADAVARTVVAPLQLPVGVLAAAVGVPTFIAMLLRRPNAPGRA